MSKGLANRLDSGKSSRSVKRSTLNFYQLRKDGITGKFHSRNPPKDEIDKGLRTNKVSPSREQDQVVEE